MLHKSTDALERVASHERFWKYVNPEPNTGCWLWGGWQTGNGYGRFRIGTFGATPAHRFAYELVHGPVSRAMHVDHLCRNTVCVNPDHLEAVTPRENWRRGGEATRKRITHCKRGHDFDEVGWIPLGPNKTRRQCRACSKLLYETRYKQRRKQYQENRRLAALEAAVK